MLGYKIAVGIDRENGPFPVMVELEIPDNATIIMPRDMIRVNSYIYVDSRIGIIEEPYFIKKYRTNKVKITNIIPENNFMIKEWNGKAYSLYRLSNFFCEHYIGEIYFIGKEMETFLDKDNMISCGRGFHFFKTKNDAQIYYENDKTYWAANIISDLRKSWHGHIHTFYSPDYKYLIKLSE